MEQTSDPHRFALAMKKAKLFNYLIKVLFLAGALEDRCCYHLLFWQMQPLAESRPSNRPASKSWQFCLTSGKCTQIIDKNILLVQQFYKAVRLRGRTVLWKPPPRSVGICFHRLKVCWWVNKMLNTYCMCSQTSMMVWEWVCQPGWRVIEWLMVDMIHKWLDK